MRWLIDTIAGRTILVLVAGLAISVAFSQWLYEAAVHRELEANYAARLADRLVILKHSIMKLPEEERDAAAHGLSGGQIELHWSRAALVAPGGQLDAAARNLRDTLIARAPELSSLGLIMGTSRSEDEEHEAEKATENDHLTLISMGLDDGTWVNVSLARIYGVRAAPWSFLLTAALMAVGVVLVSVLMGRWLTRPLVGVAEGARSLFATAEGQIIPETGTREVRELATAFNELQQRIRRLVDDRTQTLAAVSHDLRTPLTRLRLQAEEVEDDEKRAKFVSNIDEMELMIDSALTFLRGDPSEEKVQPLDLAALLGTVAADACDAGDNVYLQAPRHLVLKGRPLALKRAFSNLVHNAVKYGTLAQIVARDEGTKFVVLIRDHGPGIPADEQEAAFSPFYRLDPSRSHKTGGYGLGLTVARTVIRSHGGDITLTNLSPQGLEVRVELPRSAAPNGIAPEQVAG